MDNLPIVIYTAGSYGNQVLRVLNKNPAQKVLTYDGLEAEYKHTRPTFAEHHLSTEDSVEPPIVKVTYGDNDISIINRNKWTKVAEHLEEQADKTFPGNINRQLYTMAIHVCNLLDENNHFRLIQKTDTVEFKCETFRQNLDAWVTNFKKVEETFNIPHDADHIASHYQTFQIAQQKIFEDERTSNDDIAKSFKLGKIYYQKYKNNYNVNYFNEIFNTI